jgi:hypothetical protein
MKLPEQVWAAMFAALGVVIVVICLFLPHSPSATTALIIASNLVSGALGALKTGSGSSSTVSAPNASVVNTAPGAADAIFPATPTK